MSQSSSARPKRRRTARAAVLALAVSALGAVAAVPPVSADFSIAKCGGANAAGNGASFAKGAEEVFSEQFSAVCPGGPTVTYTADGSGAGIRGAQTRNTSRFWASDDPPTAAQVNLINAGGKLEPPGSTTVVPDGVEGNEGTIHVFPIAAGSIVPLVNLPEGCDPNGITDDSFRTVSQATAAATPATKSLLRVRFPKAVMEKIWAFDEGFRNWKEVLPGLAADADCDKPIIRVVRFDASGTTFGFKDYLDTIKEDRGWTTTFETGVGGSGNRHWPGATFGARTDCAGNPSGPGAGLADNSDDHLTSACSNGNTSLTNKVIETDGSIGYADLFTARQLANATLAVNPAGPAGPTTAYWTQVQNGSNAFSEATLNETEGFKTTAAGSPAQRGSNCTSATIFQNTPDSSLESWSQTSGVNAPQGWGLCTLTYVMVFDDNSVVFDGPGSDPAEEQAKARTIHDYLETMFLPGAQVALKGADYAPLPEPLRQLGLDAVEEIGWDKEGGGGEEKPPVDNPPVDTPKVTPPVTPPAPSNVFTLGRKSVSPKTGGATISVQLPGAGTLDVLGTAKSGKKTIKAGHTVLTAAGPGAYSVTLKPSGAAKRLLAKTGSLKVALKLTFTPNGGTASTSNSSVTLKLVKKGKGA